VADLATRIDELEAMVSQAKAMPLSSSVLLNREELLGMVGDMRDLLPEEIKQAKWVVKDREELLAKARERAEEILEQARGERAALVHDEAVVQAAEDEAARIVAEAEEQAHRIRREAEDYVDGRLEQMESVLRRAGENLSQANDGLAETVAQVSRGRRHLKDDDK